MDQQQQKERNNNVIPLNDSLFTPQMNKAGGITPSKMGILPSPLQDYSHPITPIPHHHHFNMISPSPFKRENQPFQRNTAFQNSHLMGGMGGRRLFDNDENEEQESHTNSDHFNILKKQKNNPNNNNSNNGQTFAPDYKIFEERNLGSLPMSQFPKEMFQNSPISQFNKYHPGAPEMGGGSGTMHPNFSQYYYNHHQQQNQQFLNFNKKKKNSEKNQSQQQQNEQIMYPHQMPPPYGYPHLPMYPPGYPPYPYPHNSLLQQQPFLSGENSPNHSNQLLMQQLEEQNSNNLSGLKYPSIGPNSAMINDFQNPFNVPQIYHQNAENRLLFTPSPMDQGLININNNNDVNNNNSKNNSKIAKKAKKKELQKLSQIQQKTISKEDQDNNSQNNENELQQLSGKNSTEQQQVQRIANLTALPPNMIPPIGTPQKKTRTCNCKRTKCLKLYCDCFAAGELCGPECNCHGCSNSSVNSTERYEAIQSILEKQPDAFSGKIQVKGKKQEHKKGCNCRKSGCQKKYCECYGAGVPCGEFCKCEICKNTPENALFNKPCAHNNEDDEEADEHKLKNNNDKIEIEENKNILKSSTNSPKIIVSTPQTASKGQQFRNQYQEEEENQKETVNRQTVLQQMQNEKTTAKKLNKENIDEIDNIQILNSAQLKEKEIKLIQDCVQKDILESVEKQEQILEVKNNYSKDKTNDISDSQNNNDLKKKNEILEAKTCKKENSKNKNILGSQSSSSTSLEQQKDVQRKNKSEIGNESEEEEESNNNKNTQNVNMISDKIQIIGGDNKNLECKETFDDNDEDEQENQNINKLDVVEDQQSVLKTTVKKQQKTVIFDEENENNNNNLSQKKLDFNNSNKTDSEEEEDEQNLIIYNKQQQQKQQQQSNLEDTTSSIQDDNNNNNNNNNNNIQNTNINDNNLILVQSLEKNN